MEKTENKPVFSIKDGVQGIFMVGISPDVLYQNFVLVQDHDDRGTGTGIKKYGLPGGTIELGESGEMAFIRETDEEIAFDLRTGFFRKVGSFEKLRPNGFTNNNNLFEVKLGDFENTQTNDENEVSKVCKFSLDQIIFLANNGEIHEGSIRLLFYYLNGVTSGSLNETVTWNGYTF